MKKVQSSLRKSSNFALSDQGPSDSSALVDSSEQDCDYGNDMGKGDLPRRKSKNSDKDNSKTPKLTCACGRACTSIFRPASAGNSITEANNISHCLASD